MENTQPTYVLALSISRVLESVLVALFALNKCFEVILTLVYNHQNRAEDLSNFSSAKKKEREKKNHQFK